MIRIDDERGERRPSSSILSFLENTILGRDAGTLKNNVPASIGSPGLSPPSK